MSSSRVKGEVFYGWWVVLACSLLSLYGAGTFHYGFGAFVQPVASDLGWSMALISGAFSLYRLEAGIAAPLVGFLLDKIGPRKLVMSGAILMGAGFVYMSQVRAVLPFYVAITAISLGFGFTSGTAVGAPLIGKWFVKKRGKVLGFYTGALALGGLLVPVLSHLITVYGWRITLLIIGPITLVVGLPLSFVLKHKPEEYGLLPDGEPSEYVQDALDLPQAVSIREVNFSVRSAMLTPAFGILTLCFFVFQMTMAALFVHLIPYLITVGIEARLAALAVTFVTLISVLGRVGFGWLGDRFSRKWLLIIVFLLQTAGVFALAQARQVVYIILFLLAYAPSYGGAVALRPALIGEYYGRENFGTIYGMLQGISTFGGIAGPIIAGLIYDIRGSYYLAFVILALVSLFATVLPLFLRRPSVRNDTFGAV